MRALCKSRTTQSDLYWLKDLSIGSPFYNIVSKSVSSLTVTDTNVHHHTDINNIKEDWMPAVAPYLVSSWWCKVRTNFWALSTLSSTLLILKLILFTLMTCPKVTRVSLVSSQVLFPGNTLAFKKLRLYWLKPGVRLWKTR